jgi:hypothetical protein
MDELNRHCKLSLRIETRGYTHGRSWLGLSLSQLKHLVSPVLATTERGDLAFERVAVLAERPGTAFDEVRASPLRCDIHDPR